MGLFCVNVHFRTTDDRALAAVLRRRGVAQYRIVPPKNGWTSLYEQRASEQDDDWPELGDESDDGGDGGKDDGGPNAFPARTGLSDRLARLTGMLGSGPRSAADPQATALVEAARAATPTKLIASWARTQPSTVRRRRRCPAARRWPAWAGSSRVGPGRSR